MGKKITLAQCIEQGDTYLSVSCWRCNHSAKLPIMDAIRAARKALKFGRPVLPVRLDDIPFKCSRCSRTDSIDVRANCERTIGGNPI